MSTDDLVERRPAGEAVQLGREFGLGSLEHVSRDRKVPAYAVWSIGLALVVAFVGGIVAGGIASGPDSLTTKTVVALVVGVLFVACGVTGAYGIGQSTVRRQLFRYSGGLAQLIDGEPEPRVARWQDVSEFTVSYFQGDDDVPRLDGCWLRTEDGTQLPGLSGLRRSSELRAIVTAAERLVGPRLIPALTEALEAGEELRFGRVHVGRAGIAIWPPEDNLFAWPDIRSIHLTYLDRGGYPHEVIVGRRSDRVTQTVDVSGLPNGIFLPHVLAHAARRHGVMLTGYREPAD